MNETKWLTAFEGEAMLEYAAERLKPRQWVLLAAAYVRKLWDLLPAGPLPQAIEAAERAESPLPELERADWVRRIDAAVPAAVSAAELAQREIVKSCDPDSADQDAPVLDRPNQVAPAFPLFSAASRHARNSITGIADAMSQTINAVRALFAEPNELMLSLARNRVEQAATTRTEANRAANMALRFKQEGDDLADRAASVKNKRLEEAKAVEIVRRLEEAAGRTEEQAIDVDDRRERAARKQLARLFKEIVGNPFRPPRFELAWRTSTVVELARGIFDTRDFTRMPILADALLDADCDEESILRHCRGTELDEKGKPSKEQPVHVRGCWVLELILGRWEPLPLPPEGWQPRRRRRPWDDLDIGLPHDLGDDDERVV
jgi:hypothetical protein